MAFKTTKENQYLIKSLTEKFLFKNEAAIARIAINYTLQLDKKFELKDFEEFDSDGKEYRVETLAGSNINPTIFKSLFNQHYGKILSDTDFNRLLKVHLNYGLNKINNDIVEKSRGKFSHIDYLISIVKNGLNFVSDSTGFYALSSTHTTNINEFKGKVSLKLGENNNDQEVIIELNNLDHFDSRHMAVAGMIGSGKTQLVLDLLYQFRKQSNNELNFIYIDYKGEGQSDRLQKFLKYAACEYVDISSGPFDFNPLSYISMSNERTRNFNIRSFVDAVAAIDANITIKKRNILTSVITRCFENASAGTHPTLFDVFEELRNYYEERDMDPDTLYAVVEQLSVDVFRSQITNTSQKIYNKSVYLNLPSAVSDTLRQLCVFAILNYLNTEFTSCNDAEPD
jgi:DNA sulfur modification protein DndE